MKYYAELKSLHERALDIIILLAREIQGTESDLKKANARIEELDSELQGARRVISQIPDTL